MNLSASANHSQHLTKAFLIALLAFLVYLNALPNGFMPDDEVVILHNAWIRGGDLSKLFTRAYFAASGERTYRPVGTLLHYFEWKLWEDWAPGYHLTSVLMHAFSAALFYLLLCALFSGRPPFEVRRKRTATRTGPSVTTPHNLALLAALLFAVHPVNTEAVDAVGYREDVLALTLMLAAWFSYFSADAERGWRRILIILTGCALFALSLLSKEITVGFPLLVIAGDWLFRDGRFRTAIGKRWPRYAALFVLAAAFVPLRLWIMRTPFEGGLAYTEGDFGRQALLTPIIVMHYLRILIFPVWQSGDYEFHFRGATDPAFQLALFWIVATILILIVLLRRSRIAWFGLLWVLLLLGPALNIMPMVNPMAERYLYAAAPGFCVILALPFAALTSRCRRNASVLAIGVLVLFAALTVRQNPLWGSDRERNVETVRQYPEFARPHLSLGAVYEKCGLRELAALQYRRAIRLSPKSGLAHTYYANLLIQQGLPERAVAVLRRTIEIDPMLPRVWRSLASAYAVLGQREKSEAAEGWALYAEGDIKAALAHLECIAAESPGSPPVLVPLAIVQEAAGRKHDALETWREVLRLRPDAKEAQQAVRRLGGAAQR